ncbi:hypothetical protein ScPMuIL_002366, partial [Solemya velum]
MICPVALLPTSLMFSVILLLPGSLAEETVEVTRIWPNTGGKAGGVALTIEGENFPTNCEGGVLACDEVKVFLVSKQDSTAAEECTMDESGLMSNRKITCTTQPMDEGDYHVTLCLKKFENAWPYTCLSEDWVISYCGGNKDHEDCSFTVSDGRTPTLDGVSPLSGGVGTVITMTGTTFTNQFQQDSSVWIDWIKQGDDNSEITSLSYNWNTYHASMNLKELGTSVPWGPVNITYHVSGGYGNSLVNSSTLQPVSRSEVSHFYYYPEIRQVALGTGESCVNPGGGFRISISGTFDCSPDHEVYIGDDGARCTDLSCEDAKLECTVPRVEVANTWSEGGLGLYLQGMNSQLPGAVDDIPAGINPASEQYFSMVLDNSEYQGGGSTLTEGWITAPVQTGTSTFKLTCADDCKLYRGEPNAVPENVDDLVEDVTCDGACTEQAGTSAVSLENNDRVFVRILSKGVFKLSLLSDESPFTAFQTNAARQETWTMTLNTDEVKEEKQKIAVEWGTTGYVPRRYRLCLPEEDFRLEILGVNTKTIYLYDAEDILFDALREHPHTSSMFPVVAEDNDSATPCDTQKLEISFHKGFGPLMESTVELVSATATSLSTGFFEVTVPGSLSDMETTLMLPGTDGSTPCGPVSSTDLTAASMQSVLTNCARRRCPGPEKPRTIDAEKTELLNFYGFEESSIRDQTSDLPMDGFLYTKGSRLFLNRNRKKKTDYDVKEKYRKEMVFYMKGKLTEKVTMKAMYLHKTKKTWSDILIEFDHQTLGNVNNDEWTLICLPLWERGLEKAYSSYGVEAAVLKKLILLELKVTKSDEESDVKFDPVGFFGNSISCEEFEFNGEGYDRYNMCVPPPLVNNQPYSSISVSSPNTPNEFEVVMELYGCPDSPIPYVETDWPEQDSNTYVFGSGVISVTQLQAATPAIHTSFQLQPEGAAEVIDIATDETEISVTEKLDENLNWGSVSVDIKRDSCFHYEITVKADTPGNKMNFELDQTALAEAALIVTEEKEDGGLLLDPILIPYLRTAPRHSPGEDDNLVRVLVKGEHDVPAKCSGADGDPRVCSLVYSSDCVPSISSVSITENPTASNCEDSLKLSIEGNFQAAPPVATVTLGGESCTLLEAATTEITVECAPTTSGQLILDVNIQGYGKASGYDDPIQVSPYVESIFPNRGSYRGGALLTVTGCRLKTIASLSLADASEEPEVLSCEIIQESATEDQLFCTTPPKNPTDPQADTLMTVSFDGDESMAHLEFTYEANLTVAAESITMVSPSGQAVTKVKANLQVVLESTSSDALQGQLRVVIGDVVIETSDYWFGIVTDSQFTITYEGSWQSMSTQIASVNGGLAFVVHGNSLPTSQTDIIAELIPLDPIQHSSIRLEVPETEGHEHKYQIPDLIKTVHIKNYEEGKANSNSFVEWNPPHVVVYVRDTVIWTWVPPDRPDPVELNVYEVKNKYSCKPHTENRLMPSSQKTSSGIFKKTFGVPGVYYYCEREALSASCVNPDAGNEMKLTSCATPRAISVNPNSGPRSTQITLQLAKVENFECSDASNSIKFGHIDFVADVNGCTFSVINGIWTIRGHLDQNTQAEVNVQYELSFQVKNMGQGTVYIEDMSEKSFKIGPEITELKPSTGSQMGDTSLTISGTDLGGESSKVFVNEFECVLVPGINSDTQITCQTPENPFETDLTVNVLVYSGGVLSEPWPFTYSSQSTPEVTNFNFVNEYLLCIQGGNFVAGESYEIELDDNTFQCTTTESDECPLQCGIDEITWGTKSASVQGPTGRAKINTDNILTVSPSVGGIAPLTGSRGGGLTITVTGSHLVGEQSLIVYYNGEVVPESEVQVGPEVITFKTLPTSEDAVSVKIELVFGALLHEERDFDVSDSTTRILSISCLDDEGVESPGESGKTVTFELDAPVTVTEATVCGALCSSLTAGEEASTWACILGDVEAGDQSYDVVVEGQGYAVRGALAPESFECVQTVTGIEPVGDVECVPEPEESDRTKLVLTTPPRESLDCSRAAAGETFTELVPVLVKTNEKVSELEYTYDCTRTPIATAIDPAVGGTGGGTEVNIAGNNFGTEAEKVTVTIGDAPCTVSMVTETQISCTTGEVPPSTSESASVVSIVHSDYGDVVT